jgi:hypothetical protein
LTKERARLLILSKKLADELKNAVELEATVSCL